MAWTRTSILPLAAGVAVLRFQDFQSVAGHDVLAAAYLVFGGALWAVGQVRFAPRRRATAPGAQPRLLAAVAGGAGCLALATAVLLLA